mgnify:CR=1 FL=1
MSKITEKQILYVFEHNIKDVCKIGIGTLERAKNAYRYFDSNEKSKKNKLAIFNFESTNRFAEQIILLIDEDNDEEINKVKNLLNNNGSRNILLTEKEFNEFNKYGTRTGWKKHKDWYYRTGVDATSLSNFIKIIEQNINN